MNVIPFVHALDYESIPDDVITAARRQLLDLVGVAAAGSRTELARIICAHAVSQFGGVPAVRLLFDGRTASATGAALAGGMQIDSVDAHDGHRLTKGHVGCGLLPALLAATEIAASEGKTLSEKDLLVSLVIGYELGTRAGIALHATASDYHTSGAWVAIAAAAVVARIIGLDEATTREAIGIAEFHGPRSPMMRVIDHPTMLKDGSGWGAMAGTSAALLARAGFTGSPADTVENDQVASIWSDLGERWYMQDQYIKRYPVCRWAQPAIAAALALRHTHDLREADIKSVRIGTFHEASRLDVRQPETTEQAQYSLPFPVAAALVHGHLGVAEIEGEGLVDTRVRQLAVAIEVQSLPEYDACFPAERWSDVTIECHDGRTLKSGRTRAEGDPETPLSDSVLDEKFLSLTLPVLGAGRSHELLDKLRSLGRDRPINAFNDLVYPGINETVK